MAIRLHQERRVALNIYANALPVLAQMSPSLMVIRFAFDYSASPVQLFHEDKTHHLMRECHL